MKGPKLTRPAINCIRVRLRGFDWHGKAVDASILSSALSIPISGVEYGARRGVQAHDSAQASDQILGRGCLDGVQGYSCGFCCILYPAVLLQFRSRRQHSVCILR